MQFVDSFTAAFIPDALVESDGLMAVSEKDFRELSITVEGIKGERRAWKFIPSAAILVGLAAIGWCWTTSVKVTAIEQQLADGGNTKLVAELKNPKSSQQLQANLSTVIAQIQTARVKGIPPNQEKVSALSHALAQTVEKNPETPEAWQAASELIDYRVPTNKLSVAPGDAQAACSPTAYTGPLRPNSKIPISFVLRNCSIVLDDIPSENEHVFGFLAKDQGKSFDSAFIFQNVHVIYRGQSIYFPVKAIIFQNCTFEFQLNGPPPALGNDLVHTLLVADNLSDVVFTLPPSPATHS